MATRTHSDEVNNHQTEASDGAKGDGTEPSLQKRQLVIAELIETERNYVTNLGLVVNAYMAAIDGDGSFLVPEELKRGKSRFVFGNIKAMYEWHKDVFLAELEQCATNPAYLGPLFQRYKGKLRMYEVYCRNKPYSEVVVSEFHHTFFEPLREHFGHKYQLSDLLIKPVQRLMIYKLLLKDILKYTERAANLSDEVEALGEALRVVQTVGRRADDMMSIGRLQGFDGRIDAQGEPLHQGQLMVSQARCVSTANVTPAPVAVAVASTSTATWRRRKNRQVFLFEKLLIISRIVPAKNPYSMPWFEYKCQLPLNWVTLHWDVNDPQRFSLLSTNPKERGVTWLFEAPSLQGKREWLMKIQTVLKRQDHLVRALVSPILYDKEASDVNEPTDGPWMARTSQDTLLSNPQAPSAMELTGTTATSAAITAAAGTEAPAEERVVVVVNQPSDEPKSRPVAGHSPTRKGLLSKLLSYYFSVEDSTVKSS